MMKLLNQEFKHACCVGAAGMGMVLFSVTPGLAGTVNAPAPLIGVMGPYGIAAAGIGYGGFWLYKRLKSRG